MAKSLNRSSPTLFEMPIQNNRTGYHPVWTPTLLVVPWSFDANGNRIVGSEVNKVIFSIERIIDVEVAGHPQIYPGLGIKPDATPDRILFTIEISSDQLAGGKISLDNVVYKDASGNLTSDPEEGDLIGLINSRGTSGEVKYLPDAEYFDLSEFEINVDNLPSGRYIASWQVFYYERVISANGALFCINVENEIIERVEYPIAHPGEIHDEMVNKTPAVYFEEIDKKQDFTVNLYRPFADALQDIFDESELFYGINWISKIPPQLIPYLAHLIGVDLPTRSGNLNIDKIRKTMLERGVNIQRLKGSKLAIIELFSVLGFVVDIVDLYVSIDGNKFLAPGDNGVTSQTVSQTDPLVSDFQESGFGNINIPLLYNNKEREIVVSAFQVKTGSDAHDKMLAVMDDLINNPDAFTNETIISATDSFAMLPSDVIDILDDDGVESYSRLVVSEIEVLSQQHIGMPVIRFDGVKYDRLRNTMEITLAEYKDLSNSSIFMFSSYVREKITVIDELKNNQTNRFDVDIISKSGDIEPSLYNYLLESLFSFKAFHSLLRKISFDIELKDIYNVNDFCVNSFLSQQFDSDANNTQRPPACPPDECFLTEECDEQNSRNGLRESDSELSKCIVAGLKEEYDCWKDVTSKWLDIADDTNKIDWAKSISNITLPIPNDEGDNFGQDRVSFDFSVSVDDTSGITFTENQTFSMVYNGTFLETISKTDPTNSFILDIVPAKYQILSSLVGVGVSVTINRKLDANTYYVTMDFDLDHSDDVRSKITDLSILATPDYCYKGRVIDEQELEHKIICPEIVRNKPCNLMMGTGIYYELDAGTIDPIAGWHNELTKRTDQLLHFSNNLFFDRLYSGSQHRPSINIEKHNYGFPGHRPIKGGLLQDHMSTYRARPWDFDDNCLEFLNPLMAIVVGETIQYDDADLIYYKTSDAPDIETYSGESSDEFTHSIFSTAEQRDYVEFENIEYTSIKEISIDNPIFDSASQCGTTATDSEYLDYIDGYPSDVGEFSFDAEDVWSLRTVDSDVLIEPDIPAGTHQAFAFYSSQILVNNNSQTGQPKNLEIPNDWKAYRYDCSCQEFLCDDQSRACNLIFFKNEEKFDFNNDHLEIDYTADLRENIDMNNYSFDGSIDNWLNWDFDDTAPMIMEFKDKHDIQYHIEIERDGNITDIQYDTFQPRVWGEKDDGFIKDGKVFRRGIFTRIRQVYNIINGEQILTAEGTTQEIIFKQTNYDCEFPTPEDKFIHRMIYSVQEKPEMRIPCGPHWTDPLESGDVLSIWEDVKRTWDEGIWDDGFWDGVYVGGTGTGTSGVCRVEAFNFINVWDSYDATKKFIPGVGVIDQ